MPLKVRLGRIEYVNVLPIYFALEQVFGENGFRVVTGTPAVLNDRLRRGELDVSAISSMEFARHPGKYLLLPDLSISSRGPVESVLLFSRRPFASLDGESILLSAASATGAALLRILMPELYGVQPGYIQGPVATAYEQGWPAALAIGDEALRLRAEDIWPLCLDLGAAWQELTGLPLVFGVWAVRRDFAREHPAAVAALHRLMLRSKEWGLASLANLSVLAADRFHLSAERLLAYFRCLDYSLGPAHVQGLRKLFGYLHRYGLLPDTPAPAFFEDSAG